MGNRRQIRFFRRGAAFDPSPALKRQWRKLSLGGRISLTFAHRALPIDLQEEELGKDLTAKQWAM
ncbi:MAG TPA: hypothetical protein VJ810_26110 [Blastocatellia bacterium]|nr:hypothetical protein [Blastocatellia bacterium]